MIDSSSIGKLVRVGDVPENSRMRGPFGDVLVIGPRLEGAGDRAHWREGGDKRGVGSGASVSNFEMVLLSLPAPRVGDVVPCGELPAGSVVGPVSTTPLNHHAVCTNPSSCGQNATTSGRNHPG